MKNSSSESLVMLEVIEDDCPKRGGFFEGIELLYLNN